MSGLSFCILIYVVNVALFSFLFSSLMCISIELIAVIINAKQKQT